jgi:hypothetical protein
MHTKLAARFHTWKSDTLPGISRRPLTAPKGLTFNCLPKPGNQTPTGVTETQAAAAPQDCTAAPTDATTAPPPQLPTARHEHQPDGVLTHTPWAGWYYETEPD